MNITSLDLVPPFMDPAQLHGSYMGSIVHFAEMQSELLTLMGYPPVA